MGIEKQIQSMEARSAIQALLTNELNEAGIPSLIEKRVSALWQDQEVESNPPYFSYVNPSIPSISMHCTGWDAKGEKSFGVVYQGTKNGGRLFRISGSQIFEVVLPDDPKERERVFVEALDNALNTPSRPHAFVGLS